MKVAGPVPSFILLLESRSNVQWDSDAGHFLFACYHSFLASCAALFRLLCLHCSAFSGSDRHAIIVQPGLLLALCISELIFGVLLWQASINYSNFGKQSMSQEVHLLGIQEFHASLPLCITFFASGKRRMVASLTCPITIFGPSAGHLVCALIRPLLTE